MYRKIFGIVVLFISIVGFSGCFETVSGVFQPGEILKHPEKYLFKIVTVKGLYSDGMVFSDSEDYLINNLLIELPERVTCNTNTEYKFTGIVK